MQASCEDSSGAGFTLKATPLSEQEITLFWPVLKATEEDASHAPSCFQEPYTAGTMQL